MKLVMVMRDKETLAKKLHEMSESSFKTGSPWSEKQFLSFFDTQHHYFFLVKDQEKILGFILLFVMFEDAEIELIGVDESFKRQGIGKKLLKQSIDFLISEGVSSLFIEVRESNQEAQGFYAKEGFEKIDRRKRYYRNPEEDALIWQLKL